MSKRKESSKILSSSEDLDCKESKDNLAKGFQLKNPPRLKKYQLQLHDEIKRNNDYIGEASNGDEHLPEALNEDPELRNKLSEDEFDEPEDELDEPEDELYDWMDEEDEIQSTLSLEDGTRLKVEAWKKNTGDGKYLIGIDAERVIVKEMRKRIENMRNLCSPRSCEGSIFDFSTSTTQSLSLDPGYRANSGI
ncbi:uncharacterized protein LOC111704699 [Eurytemora carolleeae]|uniref:uncharacterized protein LOC111704699 n=1 Tax=Eurytemora carolleeae TaxID=1294199 RepID=UPI000C7727F1|nr:uncharacterized protein LOC111704699 [Eurytemora carolleeae]|eukprot:XP_023332781.1 uncharacterized protein LOC111704699 [Eurytemora affinis]